jgi:hypothetical protein
MLICLICGVIVRRQSQEYCASITRMIRHYVARRAKVIEDHPHNADERALGSRISMHLPEYRQMLMAIIMRPFPLFW